MKNLVLFLLFETLSFHSISQISFENPVIYWTHNIDTYCLAEDFNNDSLDDLILFTKFYLDSVNDYKIHMYKQENNELVFEGIISYPAVFPGLSSYAVGDINNDKRKDLIIGYHDTVMIYFQNSTGFFSESNRIRFYSGTDVYGIAAGDLNHDGLDDIAVSHWNEDTVRVYHQAGPLLFKKISYYKKIAIKNELIITDINDDGFNDLVLSNGWAVSSMIPDANKYSFAIYLQDTVTGLLQNHKLYKIEDGPHNFVLGIAVEDINKDGLKDVVTTQTEDVQIWLHNKNSPLLFENYPPMINTYHNPGPVSVSDINNDGKFEIIVGNTGWSRISVYESDENHVFTDYKLFSCYIATHARSHQFSFGDLNSDGKIDIVTGTWGASSILYNNSSLNAIPETLKKQFVSEIFPNPVAGNAFWIKCNEFDETGWKLWSLDGVVISNGTLQSGLEKIVIPSTGNYNTYILEIFKHNVTLGRTKIIKI
jgi:hypothetical protein